MIKILHTSDWHLGHELYNYERKDEQRSMLGQIQSIVAQEQPDVLLIAGDVFHSSQPSSAAQRMFAEALLGMMGACPSMTAIVTAGNHDSGSRHEIFTELWKFAHVHVVGNLDRDHPESHIIPIGDKGVVVAVPYAAARMMPEGFYQQLIDLATEQSGDLPIVMTAHTTVAGSNWTGHDQATDLNVGGIDALTLDEMGSGYDYLALGHIHRPQTLDGSDGRARYSGTPLAVSFDEAYSHSVSIVEIDHHGGTPVVREVEIDNPYPLITLPLGDALPWDEVHEMLKAFKPEREGSYLRLNVLVDSVLPPTANAEAQRLAQEKGCRFCLINAMRKEQITSQQSHVVATVDELQQKSPLEIAQLYYKDKDMPWDDDLTAMFGEVEAMVREEERQS